ncbi:G-protein coupled receptor Mth2 [Lucilia cuprina]|nr:G-protein coupled receptor Mth2 [Lucilia cuprina]
MIHSDKNILERNEYCFDFQKIEIDNEMFDLINPKICAKKRQGLGPLEKFNYYLQVLSVIFLILTIIVYCSIPELLNVHGKCLLTYAGCLAMSFSIFSFINLSEIRFPIAPCLILGYLNLFLQLSHFSWLGIISYDIWKSFSDLNYDTTYRRYVKYGFALPFLMILFTYGMQNFDIYEGLKPGISSNRCGLDVYKWSAVLYLYGPCLIILILCMKFFYEMFKIINTNDRELKETEVMLQNDSPNKRYINLSEKIFESGPCFLMAYINHYTQLSHYTWLGILCYDSHKFITCHEYQASYLKYSGFGYILPLLMTLFTLAAQTLPTDDAWKPGITIERCGLNVYKWSATIYFFGPCFIILLYCLTLFISVYWTAKRNKKQMNRVQLNGPKKISYNSNWQIWQMMVICWFLDILSYILHKNEFKISSIIIDYINSLQGVYIFFIIIGQKEFRNSFKKKYCSKKFRRERQNKIENEYQRRMQSAGIEKSEYLCELDK